MAALPEKITLSGSDFFLRAMDRGGRRQSRLPHVCRMLVLLDGRLEKAALEARLREIPEIGWINGSGIKRYFPWQKPFWKSGNASSIPPVAVAESNLPGEGFAAFLGKIGHADAYVFPATESEIPGLRFDIVHHPDSKSTLAMSWHHSIMDAHGAELLLAAIASDAGEAKIQILPQSTGARNLRSFSSLASEVSASRQAIHHISRFSRMKTASLQDGGEMNEVHRQENRAVLFSGDDSHQLKENCRQLGLGFRPSLLFLSAVLRGVHRILQQRGENPAGYVVPVPQDLRKLGSCGPAFSNQVSFYFFRVEADELDDLPGLTGSLVEQMNEQTRRRVPEGFSQTMRHFLHLPLFLYSLFVFGPSKGKLASFSFSYTGQTLRDTPEVMGLTVEDALHIPPAIYPPGMTAAFMWHRDRLRGTISSAASLMTPDEAENFERRLRRDLTGMDAS
ncbi:MAG: hypothetical protein ACLFUS_03800 [Candidatus Sumerlaeia bacterium]